MDYASTTTGCRNIVPEGEAKAASARDYAAMLRDEVMVRGAPSFEALQEACADLQAKVNGAAA